jgi:hypothetical protein
VLIVVPMAVPPKATSSMPPLDSTTPMALIPAERAFAGAIQTVSAESAPSPTAAELTRRSNIRLVPIVLQKSFCTVDRKFFEP